MGDLSGITKLFAMELRQRIGRICIDFDKVYEFRLRVNNPLIIVVENKEFYISKNSNEGLTTDIENAYIVNSKELRETVEYISNYSLYAFEDEVRQGFITVAGGHRVGVCGKVFMDNGQIKSMKYISFLNIRISHEIKGCADKIIPYVVKNNEFLHTLIISPPRCGKTTLLRDIIRQISDGFDDFSGQSVGVVDERSELAGCYMGVPTNDLGVRSDVLDCCPKALGIEILLRSMSPSVIAVDELGGNDYDAINHALYNGCKILATIHGNGIDDIKDKPIFSKIIENRIFQRFIILGTGLKSGHISAVYDEQMNNIWHGE